MTDRIMRNSNWGVVEKWLKRSKPSVLKPHFSFAIILAYVGRSRVRVSPCPPVWSQNDRGPGDALCHGTRTTSRTALSRQCCCPSTTISRSTNRSSASICATWRRSKGSRRLPLTRIRRRSARAPSTNSGSILEIAQEEIGTKLPLINGIWADDSIEATRLARMATQGGASALLVFPPTPFTLGQSPQMALAHFKRIADATDLPLIVFQYPLATRAGLSEGHAAEAV